MPGTHPRNAVFGMAFGPNSGDQRLGCEAIHVEPWRQTDGVFVRPGRGQTAIVDTIVSRKYSTRGRTLARRRDVVQRVQEAAEAMGWTLTADERTMLDAFAPEGEAQATA